LACRHLGNTPPHGKEILAMTMNRIALVAEAAAESAATTIVKDGGFSQEEADTRAKNVAHQVATRVAAMLAQDDELNRLLRDKQ
jgi:hypothetical protein